jgi:hypothetical protein
MEIKGGDDELDGGEVEGNIPTYRIFPTLDEAEWASQKLLDIGMSEELCKSN